MTGTQVDGPGNSLAEWFPLVEATGVPVPRTLLVPVPRPELVFDLLDEPAEESSAVVAEWAHLVDQVQAACQRVGYPSFLRTGLLSAKHQWRESCYLTGPDAVGQAVVTLMEAHTNVMLPLADVFAVRELLRTEPIFTAFEGFPVTRERRYFVQDGVVVDHHAYWPAESLVWSGRPTALTGERLDGAVWLDALRAISDEPEVEVAQLTEYSERVGAVLPGLWSVDWLWTSDRGWVFIDAAHGEESYRMSPQERASLVPGAPFDFGGQDDVLAGLLTAFRDADEE